ncbi:MAG TPA: type III-A CRISPR-associated protein Csm2 [Candidatus Obscuribacterales bacterium]
MDRHKAGESPRQAADIAANLELTNVFKQGDEGKDRLIQIAEKFAQELAHKVKHHQLRNLLDIVIWVKQSHRGIADAPLSAQTRGRLATCRPRLAYMAARDKTRSLLKLQKSLNALLMDKDAFSRGDDIHRLYEFASALVAYHKYIECEKKS